MRVIHLIVVFGFVFNHPELFQSFGDRPQAQCAEPQRVPIRYFHSLPYVKLEVGEEAVSVNMLLDTGSTFTTLSDTLLDRAGGELTGDTIAKLGQYGVHDWPVSDSMQISANGCSLTEVPVNVVTDILRNSDSIPQTSRKRAPGYAVLGLDVLNQFSVEINFVENYLELNSVGTEPTAATSTALSANLEFEDKSFACLVDTGAPEELKGVYIRSESNLATHLRAEPRNWRSSTFELSRSGVVAQTRLTDFSLGGLAGDDLLLQVENLGDMEFEEATQFPPCIVGMNSLSAIKLEVMPHTHNVRLLGNFPISSYNRSGISSVSGSQAPVGFRVEGLRPGGPAEEAGVIIGDVIMSIRGKPIHETSVAELINAMSERPGSTVELQVSDAFDRIRSVEIVLRDTL